VRTLQDAPLAKGSTTLNVSKVDDFAYIKDKTFILACGELGKGQRGTLEDALNLGNRCGHPTRYKPGAAKAASFIEDVVGIAWK
jgi:hypothetical protein